MAVYSMTGYAAGQSGNAAAPPGQESKSPQRQLAGAGDPVRQQPLPGPGVPAPGGAPATRADAARHADGAAQARQDRVAGHRRIRLGQVRWLRTFCAGCCKRLGSMHRTPSRPGLPGRAAAAGGATCCDWPSSEQSGPRDWRRGDDRAGREDAARTGSGAQARRRPAGERR